LALLLQVLSVLAAGAVIVVLLREAAERRVGAPLATALAALAAVWGMFAFGSDAWSFARGLVDARGDNASLPPEAIRGAGGAIFPAREDILKIVDDRIPKQDSVFLACRDPACGSGLNVWITFRLAPRIFTEAPGDADWVLLYNATLSDARLRRSDLVDPVVIADRYEIARLR
jgi:hypothetical protein